MIGSLIDHWKYAWPDIWSVLARSRKAPSDLFIDLYRTATDSLENPPEYKQFELAMNDPMHARQAFEQIRAQDFGDELSIAEFHLASQSAWSSTRLRQSLTSLLSHPLPSAPAS